MNDDPMDEMLLTADEHVAEAGRFIMSQQLAAMQLHEEGVRTNAAMTAVHEMRKAIRRTFTCFKLFRPFYDPGTLKPYRRGLRRIMRRLGYSRDLAVFRMKLDAYNELLERPLDDLASYYESRQEIVDASVMDYLAKKKQQNMLAKYRAFTETPGKGVLESADPWAPVKIRHHVPIMIYQRVAAVRAFDDRLHSATVQQLHRLRIQFKELRYSLQFFTSLFGEEIQTVLANLKQSQEHLGDLNDTTVALQFLNEMTGFDSSAALYRAFQAQEQERLVGSYWLVWQRFDQPTWRRDLAEAIATL
jgi:CHAD domain-containing protein